MIDELCPKCNGNMDTDGVFTYCLTKKRSTTD